MARKKAVDELFTTHFYPFVQTEIKSIMGLFAVVFCRNFEMAKLHPPSTYYRAEHGSINLDRTMETDNPRLRTSCTEN